MTTETNAKQVSSSNANQIALDNAQDAHDRMTADLLEHVAHGIRNRLAKPADADIAINALTDWKSAELAVSLVRGII